MNTIVFVLLVYGHGGNWIPTMEFTTEAKCVAAAKAIDKKTNEGSLFDKMHGNFCMRIEK